MPIYLDTPADETQEEPTITTLFQRRLYHEAHAARHLYLSQWVPGMPEYYQLSRAGVRRCRNAIAIGASSLDMVRISREGQ